MPDTAFIPQSQSEYAFPPSEQDEASQSEQRNQQIQAAFDSQRFQRGYLQSIGKRIAQVAARQAQQKS